MNVSWFKQTKEPEKLMVKKCHCLRALKEMNLSNARIEYACSKDPYPNKKTSISKIYNKLCFSSNDFLSTKYSKENLIS